MAVVLLAFLLQDPDALVQELRSDDIAARARASRKLLELREKAVPALVPALESPDPEVRARAEDILGRMVLDLPADTLERHPRLKELRVRREVLSLLEALDKESLRSFGHGGSPLRY